MKVLDVDSPSPHHLGLAFSWMGLSSAHSAQGIFEMPKTAVYDMSQDRNSNQIKRDIEPK